MNIDDKNSPDDKIRIDWEGEGEGKTTEVSIAALINIKSALKPTLKPTTIKAGKIGNKTKLIKRRKDN